LSKIITAYYRPQRLDDALQQLQQPDTKAIAGGAHLLAADTACAVVDLQSLGLNQIELSTNQLSVGATATLTEIDVLLAEQESEAGSFVRKAVRQAGPNTYRNAATLGGIIARRLPDSELLAALLVLDATLMMRKPDETAVSLSDYLQAAERPFGLITTVHIPWLPGKGSNHRVARTPADYPIVSITCWQAEDGVRLAATGLDKRPFRLHNAETALEHGITETAIADAAQAARDANQHPGDFRGDAAYRADMAAVLTKRAVG
jgi:CO/xanthine dehydrogenase FAD-binding subunit